MTREEAIELIKHISIAFVPTDQYGDYNDPQPYEEALDMAIEALKEQEISKELQEYAYECGYEHFFHECQNCEHRRGVHSHCKPTHGRLIDADALVKAFEGCMPLSEDTIIRTIRTAPTVQADRPHGEWVFNPTDAIDLMFAKPKCSKCGFESSDGGNFCSNCGADMKGAEHEHDK